MKWLPRIMAGTVRKAVRTFPAVVLTGPRQSGKTTLFKMLFSGTHRFVSLENPDVRIRAQNDPVGFLSQYQPPLVIDEIQYVPDLLSYIKTRIDEDRRPGQWLLTGSQNFALMHGVTQSLAGRVAVLDLLPLTLSESLDKTRNIFDIGGLTDFIAGTIEKPPERQRGRRPDISIGDVLLRGFYPEPVCNPSVDRHL